MQIIRGEKEVDYHFDGYGEMVDFAENRTKSKNAIHVASRRNGGEYGSGFSGTSTFEEALKLARNGWSEGREKVKALSSQILDKVTALVERPELTYDVTGSDFDMGLLMSGAPEHWYTIENRIEEGKGTRILKVVVNMSASAMIDKDMIIARGAVSAALIEALEYSGFRCEVWVVEKAGGYGYNLATYACVKQADQQLDMDRLSFACVHPASLRRIVFAVAEADDKFMEFHDSGYGSPQDVPQEQRGDIYFKHMMGREPQWDSVEGCISFVLAELKKQGVTISE